MFKTVNGGKLPTRASKFSAGIDVYANEDVIIGAGETKIIPLGIKIDKHFIKEMFVYDDIGEDAILNAKEYYPESYKEWLDEVLDGGTPFFEFEHVEEADGDILYGCASFNINKYNDFMKLHYIALKPRSSLRAKGLISHTGVIDLDYPDEIKMIIQNPLLSTDSITTDDYNASYIIKKGDKIGQLLLMEHKSYLFDIESEDERAGGFGSSGER